MWYTRYSEVFNEKMTFFSCNALQCTSMNNQECKTRPQVVNINIDNPFFYLYSILVNKWRSSCNNTSDPYSKLCVSNAVKNITPKYLI